MDGKDRGPEVAVVGGGIAGLAAAALAARAGRSVVLFEKGGTVGGRATTQVKQGFHLNQGPHALYRGGAARAVLRELGIVPAGGMPSASAGHAIAGGAKHTLPGGPISLLTSGLLGLPAKIELARFLGGLARVDTGALQATPADRWLAAALRHARARELVAALFRLSTYANDPERLSAGAALDQLRLALAANVLYLDGGWQTLVDGLRAAATAAGVRIASGARVVAVERDSTVRAVRLADGTLTEAGAVVLATDPATAAELAGDAGLAAGAGALVPVLAACLDVCLASLPRRRSLFALGIDRPLYLSVHSAVAKLAPEGGALVHVARYLPPGAAGGSEDERELEGLLDLVQPGWRDVLVARRFLPRMVVSNALVTAAGGGLAGRPAVEVPGAPGLYLAGDWVGAQGMLADASLASARRAAELAAASAATRRAA
jgi:phytoene dehydrogenase-like protein